MKGAIMPQIIEDSSNACGLEAYKRALSSPAKGHGLKPEGRESHHPTSHDENQQVNNGYMTREESDPMPGSFWRDRQRIPEIQEPDVNPEDINNNVASDVPATSANVSFDDIERAGHLKPDRKQSKKIYNEVDDAYSEAEQSILEGGSVAPSWAAKQRRGSYGDDSDTSDKDVLGYGDNDDIYDSDLDSVVSGTRRVERTHHKKMRKWRAEAKGRFENMLLECIVNIDEIPSSYENIVVSRSVTQELENVTRMSLKRPLAFSHGVLKGNRVTGAILYGPPGTGKTLLAKALARQSEFNMLSISTAELWQKCHGEDEKVIKAVFSLGRKLNPCIVFLDEADAMLGARKAGEKRHIRSMLNQFLLEWDGLTSGRDSPFILLATNRPFDLDPAVLRRAPMQILLDVPTPKERLEILKKLLDGEKLVGDVTYDRLVRVTHGYTGSDLKNLCVTAATNCVAEQVAQKVPDTNIRSLTWQHFSSAMDIIKPTSLSSVMKNEFQKFRKNAGENEGVHEE